MPESSQPILSRPIPQNSSFELFAWLFMRVSGLVLLFMAIGHLVIMHLIHSINTINYAFVAERWATPFWRAYDGIMLLLALIHGSNGLRTILDDFLSPGKWRIFCRTLLYVLSFILLAGGFWVIVSFKPQ